MVTRGQPIVFFHPHGLALEVSDVDKNGHYDTLRIWDYREDPEGILFGEGVISDDKIHTVELERSKHATERRRIMGGTIQRQYSVLKK